MKRLILLVILFFTLSCTIATESSQTDITAIVNNPKGIPIVVFQPIRLDYSGKIVAQVGSNTEHGGFMIPCGTKLVFYYKARTKDAALPVINVDYMQGRMPNGCPLVLHGQNSIEVGLAFTNPGYLVDGGKEVKAASKANVLFIEGGGLKPRTIEKEQPPSPLLPSMP